jgi:hypothetical protein
MDFRQRPRFGTLDRSVDVRCIFIRRGIGRDQCSEQPQRTGELWQQESYDRIIRDEVHLYRVIQYIGRNPKNAGRSNESCRLWLDPTWEKPGWGFGT